jgi:arylsulfatase A-like enzyme
MAARACTRFLFHRLLLAGALAVMASCAPEAHPRPNVLVILADDLGFGDLGVYGRRDAGTPHIDDLAAEGVRFTRHYADSSCAPARAALLTGRHPARFGFRPRGRGLRAETTTLAELLRDHGYETRHLGKWHLGGTGIWGLDASPASALPSGHGFNHWFGFLDPRLLRGPRFDLKSPSPEPDRYGLGRYSRPFLLGSHAPAAYQNGHLTDLLTEHAVEFIRSSPEGPWFLNLWYLAPHGPIQPDPRYLEGLTPRPSVLYRALVKQLDDSVGRVLAALAESEQAENTIVVLLSDNGGAARFDPISNAPFEGRKGQFSEGGTRTPLMFRWPGHIEPGGVVDVPVSILDVFPTIAALLGTPSPGVDGHDLSPLFEDGEIPPRPLFWEQIRPGGGPYYSVLSEDGRFRLSRWLGKPTLLDLTADPSGGTDLGAEHPDELRRLEALYRRWRREVSRLTVTLSTDTDGLGLAKGDDLQRSPGWGGFTFGVGVTPAERETRPANDEIIAHQRDLWELVRIPREALRLRMHNVELQGRKLQIGECNAVVVTGNFLVSAWEPEGSGGTLALYLDGQLQDSIENAPLPPLTDLSAPTLLGLATKDRDAFRGRLAPPIFLNTRVVANGDGTEQTVAELTNELCPPGT